MRTKEIKLQKLAQMTEYFMAKDLTVLFREIVDIVDGNQFEHQIEDRV